MLLAAGLLAWAALASAAGGLNDTGITGCTNATQNNLPCPQPGYPSQDAETGRDAQPNLPKVGAGPAGFDFTKLGSAGQPLPDSATNWDCIRDNVTGLIWEIKTDDNGLRDKDWTYTWYNPDSATNGDSAGSTGSDTCNNSTLPGGLCNTQAYAAAVNALAAPLCGKTDWRLPTREELRSIDDYSEQNFALAPAYFPGPSTTGTGRLLPMPPTPATRGASISAVATTAPAARAAATPCGWCAADSDSVF